MFLRKHFSTSIFYVFIIYNDFRRKNLTFYFLTIFKLCIQRIIIIKNKLNSQLNTIHYYTERIFLTTIYFTILLVV